MCNPRCIAGAATSVFALVGPLFAADLHVATTTPAAAFNVREEVLGEKSPSTKAEDVKEDVASPDRMRVAWRDKSGEKWVVKLNGVQQPGQFDEVKSILFSPDSQHLAFFGKRGKTWAVIVDGVEQASKFAEVGSL